MPAVAIAGASLVGGAMQSSAASKAADAQKKAADQQVQLQRDVYDQTTENYAPYLNAGNTALDAYMYEMGLGAAPTIGGRNLSIEEVTTPGRAGDPYNGARQVFGRNGDSWGGYASNGQSGTPSTTQYKVGGQTFGTRDEAQAYIDQNSGGTAYQGFQATPGYQFQLSEGLAATNALAGAKGGLNSGATLQALQERGQGIANQEYGAYMNRLAGLTDMGQASAGNQAAAGNAYATGAGNALAGGANAQAAGYIGSANAISQGINNGISAWQYQNTLNQGR